jgi:hypothetical protein
MFNSRSMELIEESIRRAKADNDGIRKKHIENRIKILHDNFKELVENELREQFCEETFKLLKLYIDDSNNVFKRIINEISTVYKNGAKRKAVIPGTPSIEDARYNEIHSANHLDLIMAKANRNTNALNEMFVKVSPRGSGIGYDLINPDIVDIIQRKDDPTKMEAFIYRNSWIDTIGDVDYDYIYWDIWGTHKVFDKNGAPMMNPDNPKDINPYKDPENPGQTIIPVSILHREYNTDRIFDVTSGKDLYSLCISTGILLTYYFYLLKMCSFKQLSLQGYDPKLMKIQNILDPAFPLVTLNENAKANVLDYQIDLDKIFNAINNRVRAAAANYGISADQLTMSVQANSGFSLQIKRQGLEETRESQLKSYRVFEKDIFNITRIVNNTHYGKKISDLAEFQIDFVEISYPTDDADVRANWQFWLQTGAKSLVDFVRFLNPDLDTDEKALAVLAKNTELNKQASLQTGMNIDALFASFAPAQKTQATAQQAGP